MGKQWKQCQTWFLGAPKSLQMVNATMKLKDAYSLEEKLWPTRWHIEKQRHYFANKGPSSQGYGFSSGHVWMWELNHKEGWRPKNGLVLQRLNGFLQKRARLCFKLSSKRGMDTQSHCNRHWTIWQLLSFFQTSDDFSLVAWFRKLPFALQILGKEGVVPVLS